MDGKEQVGQDQTVHPLPVGGQPGQVPPGHVPLKPVEGKGQDSQDKANHSTEDEKVYTTAEVEAIIAKRHSKLDQRIAGLEKKLEQTGNTVAENAELRKVISDLKRQYDEAELEKYRDDPDMFDIKKRELELARREEALNAKEVDINQWLESKKDILERLNQFDMLVTASELAKDNEIDVTDLLELGASTPEQMKRHAEYLAKKTKKADGAPDKSEKPPDKPDGKAKTMKPDSAVGAGAGGDLSHLSPVEKIKMGLAAQQTKK